MEQIRMRKSITLYFLASTLLFGCMQRSAVETVVRYKNGKVKTSSKEQKMVFRKMFEHEDVAYYESGKLKSKLVYRYAEPSTESIDSQEPDRYALLVYKNYTVYHENGKLKEKGKLVKGSGQIQEFDETGKLLRTKKIENFINIGTDNAQKP